MPFLTRQRSWGAGDPEYKYERDTVLPSWMFWTGVEGRDVMSELTAKQRGPSAA